MSRESRKNPNRPLNPTEAWIEYETKYSHLILSELKVQQPPELYRRLQRSDELHFVPTDKLELRAEARETVPKSKTFVVSDLRKILIETAQKSGIGTVSSLYGGLDAAAFTVRNYPGWKGHSSQVSGPSGGYYEYSAEVCRAILIYFAKRKRGVDDALRTRWLAAINQHFAESKGVMDKI